MAIRSWGTSWRVQVQYSPLAKVVYTATVTVSALPSISFQDNAIYRSVLHRYILFMDFVTEYELQDARFMKPVLDWNALKELFGVQIDEGFLAFAIEALVAW
jgi:hypothetical protein